MNVYLNDLSLQSGKSILDNMPMIKKFNTLLEKLSSVSNITFCASHNLWDTPISGYNVKTGECTSGSIPYDYAMYLKVLYSKFSPTIADTLPYFSETEEMKIKSSAVGTACVESSPVISFTFDGQYAKDTISGWLQEHGKAVSRSKVNNIYEDKPSISL